MKSNNNKEGGNRDTISSRHEIIKSISIVISTIVISLTGTLLTYRYNTNQLEITKTKELTKLLPKLRSTDTNEQMQSIVGLSLYGKDAIQPLISVWGHSSDGTINSEVLNSILIIGKITIPDLLSVYRNRYETMRERQWAFLALIRLNYKGASQLVKDAILVDNFDHQIVSTAMLGVGDMKIKELLPKVIQVSKKFRDIEDYILLKKNIMYALKLLGGHQAKKEILEYLNDSNPEIRTEALISMMELGEPSDIPVLLKMKSKDENKGTREWASYVINVIEIKYGI